VGAVTLGIAWLKGSLAHDFSFSCASCRQPGTITGCPGLSMMPMLPLETAGSDEY
jgi:hypothetical protein